jgi:hypothetical protein
MRYSVSASGYGRPMNDQPSASPKKMSMRPSSDAPGSFNLLRIDFGEGTYVKQIPARGGTSSECIAE